MGPMQVTITNAGAHQRIEMLRDDGSRAETTFPHKGPFPHDAVHLWRGGTLYFSWNEADGR